jgi:hypothetical protein
LRAGVETLNRRKGHYYTNVNANGGLGLTTQTHWLRREVYFAFSELDANGSARRYRIGGGSTLGALLPLSESWKILASVTYLYYPVGNQGDVFRAFFGYSYALRQNLALRFEFHYREKDMETSVQFHAYF